MHQEFPILEGVGSVLDYRDKTFWIINERKFLNIKEEKLNDDGGRKKFWTIKKNKLLNWLYGNVLENSEWFFLNKEERESLKNKL